MPKKMFHKCQCFTVIYIFLSISIWW